MTGVAIVIPMLNEAAGLPRLLRSVAVLEPPPAEVLAVDGGSTDASVAIAEAAGLLVVRHDTSGRAAAINRGVQEAPAPIICVLHADTLLPDDAVAVIPRRALNRAPAQIACGDAVVDQPLQEGLIGARTRASAQGPQIRVLEPGVTLK